MIDRSRGSCRATRFHGDRPTRKNASCCEKDSQQLALAGFENAVSAVTGPVAQSPRREVGAI
jgi:hypothetical protein